jgi:ribonuclease-3
LLFDNFPDLAESQLTLSKIFLVKEKTLAIVARNIGLGEVMRIGTGEERSGGRDKDSVLSDGLEALIAFIYLQYGRPEVEIFIEKYIYVLLGNEPVMPQKSRKNQLQELVQKYHNEIPRYENIDLEIDKT